MYDDTYEIYIKSCENDKKKLNINELINMYLITCFLIVLVIIYFIFDIYLTINNLT